jgi:DNA replicative helicase MCM subunit Mcm2 (Cdc46/Mcm family)
MIEKTTKDWEVRTNKGIIRFDPLPNQTMNKISKQVRTNKEETRGFTQRENLYKKAFDKIIKPIYPNLSIKKHLTYFLIKS